MSCNFRTIEDFLSAQPLTVDVEIDEAAAGCFPVKGIEFETTVLYAGVKDFTKLSTELSPAEMLVYLDMFLAWICNSVNGSRFSVLEKFLDSAVLLLFSARFGSKDPFVDALQAARWLGENDTLKFLPSIGIASGTVMAGFAGVSAGHTASVFGRPVILAAGFAKLHTKDEAAATITVPAGEWNNRNIDDVFPPFEYDHPEKGRTRQPHTWKIGKPYEVDFPGLVRMQLLDIANFIHWMPAVSACDKAREWVSQMRSQGYYKKQ
ncbi:MAG: adenylate cyclase [Chlorobiaceae bacterium]|nr:adenylate cyclase [Chlorobiaceae bacterium]